MYGDSIPFVYDLLNTAKGKDYEAEAAAVVELIGRQQPAARSIRDVGR